MLALFLELLGVTSSKSRGLGYSLKLNGRL